MRVNGMRRRGAHARPAGADGTNPDCRSTGAFALYAGINGAVHLDA